MRRAVAPLLAVTVALVLADSAVVTLALPDILRHLDASVAQVAWVLIAFNLVLGLGAVPAAMSFTRAQPAHPQRRRHRGVRRRLGVVRGGAVDRRADRGPVPAGARRRARAGRVPGAAGRGVRRAPRRRGLGHGRRGRHGHRPVRRRAAHRRRSRGRRSSWCRCRSPCWRCRPRSPYGAAPELTPDRHRPAVRPNLTLALLSAALTAALFLLVLLLVEGWRHSPATAALTVSVVPVAALAARPLARLLRPPPEVEVAVGCFLVAGGLVGLAIPPSADLAWTIAPQALVGLGLGLTVDRLTVAGDGAAAAAGAARGLDHRRPPRRRGRRAGDPDAGVHRRPAGRPGARPGGDHLPGARRSAAAAGQDRARPGARRRAVRASRVRSPTCTAPSRPLDLDPEAAPRRRRARARPRRPARARRHPGLPRLVPHRRRPRAARPAHRGRARAGGGRHDRRRSARPACRRSRWSWWAACSRSSSPTAAGPSSRSSPADPCVARDGHLAGRRHRRPHRASRAARHRRRRLPPGRQPRGADPGARAARHPHRRRDRRPARGPAAPPYAG